MKKLNMNRYARTGKAFERKLEDTFRPYRVNPYERVMRGFEDEINNDFGRYLEDSFKRTANASEGKRKKGLKLHHDPNETMADKIKCKTKKIFENYRFKIKMKYCETGLNGTLIYRVRFPKGKKSRMFFDLLEEVQRDLRLSCEAFEEDYELYLAISIGQLDKIDLVKTFHSPVFRECLDRMKIPVVIGCDFRGEIIVEDLAKSINLLVGGLPGSGKSVFLQCLIFCIIAFQKVQQVNLVVIDIGSKASDDDIDLTVFNGTPHLSCDVVEDIETAEKTIFFLKAEMDRRFKEHDARTYIVCIIDEFSSLISNIRDKEVRERFIENLSDLLMRGRKSKIILALAAQNPTQENMKIELADIETRIAFKCAQHYNSTTILGEVGAEKLSGEGEMYLKSPKHPNRIRLQGAFPEPEDIKELVSMLASEPCDTTGKFEIHESDLAELSRDEDMALEDWIPPRQEQSIKEKRDNQQFCRIILWTLQQDTVSAKKIMDTFRIGNNANLIINRLTDYGIVSEQFAKQPRQVLINRVEDLPDEVKALLINNGFQVPVTDEAEQEIPEPKEADHDQ